MPVVGDAANRAEHVAAFKGCGEFLFSEVLPAGGAGAAGRYCFLLLPLFLCGLVVGADDGAELRLGDDEFEVAFGVEDGPPPADVDVPFCGESFRGVP